MRPTFDIVTFSHLRWDFVLQRPQHLLSRLAKNRRVFYIEEPIHTSKANRIGKRIERWDGNITVCRPHTPIPQGGFCDAQMGVFKELVAQLIARRKADSLCCLVLYAHGASAFRGDCSPSGRLRLHGRTFRFPPRAAAIARLRIEASGAFRSCVHRRPESLSSAKRNRHPNVY